MQEVSDQFGNVDEEAAKDAYYRRMSESEQSIEEHARTVSKAVSLANYPILLLSNTILFGRVMGGDFGIRKGVFNRMGAAGKAFFTGETKGVLEGATKRITMPSIREMIGGARATLTGNTTGGKVARGITQGFLKPAFWEGNEEMLQKVATEGFSKWADENTFYGIGENPSDKEKFLNSWSTF